MHNILVVSTKIRDTRQMSIIEKPKSLSNYAYEHILVKIKTHEYFPGMRITENLIAEELEISSSPIREALKRLEQEYWIKVVPYSGSYVREFGAKEIEDMYGLREAMEGFAGGLVATRGDEKVLGKLKKIMKQIRRLANDDGAGAESDLEFHKLLIEASGNDWLRNMMSERKLLTRMIHVIAPQSVDRNMRDKIYKEHMRIVKGIEKRDQAAAEKAVRNHIRKTFRRIAANLKD